MKKFNVCCLVLLVLVACETKDYSYRLGNEGLINFFLEESKEGDRFNFDINGFNLLNSRNLHMLPPHRSDTTNLKHFVILDAAVNEISVYSNGKYYYYQAIDTSSSDVLYNFEATYPPY